MVTVTVHPFIEGNSPNCDYEVGFEFRVVPRVGDSITFEDEDHVHTLLGKVEKVEHLASTASVFIYVSFSEADFGLFNSCNILGIKTV